jgi:hypothetical protein
MSFLSRKPVRPGGRGDDAGRNDEYGDDYDYAAEGYQGEDESWSPGEYFSPEGIKGRWAGHEPAGRSGGRGRGADSYDSAAYGSDGYPRADSGPDSDSYRSDGYGGYGADEYATGAYDLPEGADDERQERGRRRRKDREDTGERTGIFRLRRDRGEDIWPDDGISDEDYWASVAADRPLNGADSPLDDPLSRAAAADSRLGGDRSGTDRAGLDRSGVERAGLDRGGEPRGVTGRLGPAPGLAGGSGRPATGPTPTVGVTASRPPTGPTPAWQGPSRAGANSGGFQAAPTPPRPSFQPTGQAGGRQQDRGDWGERTERIERVNAAGYPEPRVPGRGPGTGPTGTFGAAGTAYSPAGRPGSAGANGSAGALRSSGPMRSQGPAGTPRASGPMRSAGSPGSRSSGPLGPAGAPGRGRGDAGRGDSGEWRTQDRRDASRDLNGRDLDGSGANGRDISGSGAWPAPPRGGTQARTGSLDDPLTSSAYSRAALTETDGRSYRVAARRSQAQTQLTEHTETFITGGYQPGQYQTEQYQTSQYTGEYPAYPAAEQRPSELRPSEQRSSELRGSDQRTGEYRQFRDAPATAAPGGRYTAHSGQPGQPGGPAQRSQSGQHAQPSQPARNSGRVSIPGTGGFPAAPSYEPQQQPRAAQQGQHRQPQLPPASANGYSAGLPASAAPLSAPVGGPAAGPSGPRMTASGGLNPYDSAVTGSYPYPGQPFPSRPAAASGSTQDAAEGRYYRPAPDGYPASGTDQARPGYRDGQPAPRDGRY